MRLLIADDDMALSRFLGCRMEAEGHQVRTVHDGLEAVAAFRDEAPDLTILDLNMPVKDGENALCEMRAVNAELPILILTGRVEVHTRVRCLDCGADDLLIKPFSLSEFQARCRVLLRRKKESQLVLRAGDVELCRLEHVVRHRACNLSLTNKEFALLEHLMLNRGHCVTRLELLETVWKGEPVETTNIVDVYVNYLRRKLDDAPPGGLIRTVRGKGYMVPFDSQIAA
jgi:DNA-binding response OmpR family regulator